MPGAFDGLDEHPLVTRACAGDSLGNNAALLGDKPLKLLLVFVIDIHVFVFAESADPLLSHLSAPGALIPLVAAVARVA